MARSVRHEERCLEQLARALDLMLREISGRLTPVGELFDRALETSTGAMRRVFHICAQRIGVQTEPNIRAIMDCALDEQEERLPQSCICFLRELGEVLGLYDVEEQVGALRALSGRVGAALAQLRQGKADRCRSYEVLGVCAGCALAIVLL